jgi:mono/diheme cytochrome c family protein
VTFAQVFPVLVASCGNCHGANAPGNRPRFAQAGNEAASFTATQGMSGGGVVSARIVVRGVTDRDMPPACNGNALGTGQCLDVAEGALLQAWVAQGAPR